MTDLALKAVSHELQGTSYLLAYFYFLSKDKMLPALACIIIALVYAFT